MLKQAVIGLLTMGVCETPPLEFQGESVPAVIVFAHPDLVHEVCAAAGGVSPSQRILACTNTRSRVMLMPDPCLYDDGYSALLCHERSHLPRADGSPGWRH